MTMNIPRCKVEGCESKVLAKGMCGRHYAQIRSFGKIVRTIYDNNDIVRHEDHAEIILRNKQCEEVARAKIDLEDINKVSGYKWHGHKRKSALSPESLVREGGRQKIVYLSNVIMDFQSDYCNMVDHIDHDILNARKENLRVCTSAQNACNRVVGKNNSSGYKGISFRNGGNKWRVRVGANGKRNHIGDFTSLSDAVAAHTEATNRFHKEFAYQSSLPGGG